MVAWLPFRGQNWTHASTLLDLTARQAMILLLSILSLSSAANAQTGTPIPLGDGQILSVLQNINVMRSQQTGMLMECIRFWSRDLATTAQQVANNCSVVPTDTTLPLVISASGTADPAEAFKSIAGILNFLNDDRIGCQPDFFSDQQCQYYRQFYRYDLNVTGCAASNCPAIAPSAAPDGQNFISGVLWVCVYGNGAPKDQVPFIQIPAGGQPCQTCPSTKSGCNETFSMNLCCDAPISDLVLGPGVPVGPGSPGGPGGPGGVGGANACGAKPANLTNVFRFYDNPGHTNFLSFVGQNATFPEFLQTTPERYTHLGIMGSVVMPGDVVPDCPFLVPIRHLFSSVLNQNLYLTDTTEITNLIREGHKDRGIVGQAVTGSQMCNSSIAMYRFFNPALNAVQLANQTDVTTVLMGMPPGYMFQGISFYLWDPVATA